MSNDVEAALGRALADVAAAHGFGADHRLDLVGRCDACR